MADRIFISRDLPGDGPDRLRRVAAVDVWEEVGPPSREILFERIADCTGIISMVTERVDSELLDTAPHLRIVANVAVGYDNIDVAACTARGVLVGNTPGVLTGTTAELTWALILATTRRLVEAAEAARNGEWPPWNPTWMCGTDLAGATLGIVGYGAIGQAVARRATAFDMRVIHSSRKSGVSLDELLCVADVVSLHCPLNEHTTGLIGVRELGLMKSSAVLINTSRGPVVDQTALATALTNGVLRAAGIDVSVVEPIPIDDPLLSLSNCIVLPHIGSATIATRTKMADLAVANVLAWLAGEKIPHCVNPG
jgi:lactate dehydrogenase-like 2-hydroxyacid dehydrogenase